MLVSVIIVTRNRASVLMECLKTVTMQDYPDIEIIVVDNDSSDDTQAILAREFPDVRVFHQNHNAGAPEGRNIGMSQANGALGVFLDDDAEIIGTDAISKAVRYFEEKSDLAALNMQIVNPDGSVAKKLIPRRDRKTFPHDTEAAMFSATFCMFRMEAFLKAGGFWKKLSPYFGSEPDLSYRLLENGNTIMHTPFIKAMHHEVALERPSVRRLYYGTRNTPWLAMRSLPWPSVVSLTVLAWGYFFVKACYRMQLPAFFAAVLESIKGWREVYAERQPISKETQWVVKKHSGIFYW